MTDPAIIAAKSMPHPERHLGLNPKDLVGSKKAPLGLVPPALEIGASEAMADGAAKYGPFNWRETPVEYMTYLVAMKRHIDALIDGEDYASDSGIHHLHHIVAGGGILIDALGIPGALIDNRPPKGPAAAMLRALDKSTIAALDAGLITEAAFLAAVDGTEGGDVLPLDHEIASESWEEILPTVDVENVGCDPSDCLDPDCGVHNPVLGLA